jgi:hypothetical protein
LYCGKENHQAQDCSIKALASKLHKVKNVSPSIQSKVDDVESKTKISSHCRDCKVGECCLIFNQRFYPYFQSFSLFYYPLIVKMDSNSIKVYALLDFGDFAYFVDKNFVDCHKTSY